MERTIDLKIAILGEGGVGKTSIVNKYLGEEFQSDYIPTIGSNTNKKYYEFSEKELSIRINIWDFGGQRSFNPINPIFYSNVDIAILVFDLSRPAETLENIKKYFLGNLNEYSTDFISLIVGNKLDLISLTNEFKQVMKKFLNEGDYFALMSAKTGENVKECFDLLIYNYLKRAELLTPDIVQENISDSYLKIVGKDEDKLRSCVTTLNSLDSPLVEIRSIDPNKNSVENVLNDDDVKYHNFIQKELIKVNNQKRHTFDQFLVNLSNFEIALNDLKISRGKSFEMIKESLKTILNDSRENFTQNYSFIQRLNREENELRTIYLKLKKKIFD